MRTTAKERGEQHKKNTCEKRKNKKNKKTKKKTNRREKIRVTKK